MNPNFEPAAHPFRVNEAARSPKSSTEHRPSTRRRATDASRHRARRQPGGPASRELLAAIAVQVCVEVVTAVITAAVPLPAPGASLDTAPCPAPVVIVVGDASAPSTP